MTSDPQVTPLQYLSLVILASCSAMAVGYRGIAEQMGWPMGTLFIWKAPLCGIAGFLVSIVLVYLHAGVIAALVVALVSVLLISSLVLRFARVWTQPIALAGMAVGVLWVVVGFAVRR